MRFWRLVARGKFRQAWEILSQRPDSEHEQALIRWIMTGVLFAYISWSHWRSGNVAGSETHLLFLKILAVYNAVSFGLFLRITFHPGKSVLRRSIGIAGDLLLTTYGIATGGDVSGPLYVVLLWVIFGNGFRYGRKYLFASAAIGTVSFGTAVYLNAYWRDRPLLAAGLLVGLVVLPLYVSSLLRKLTAAGHRAEEANRAKNRFLANMSHEMRTPLNGIVGMLDLLKGTPLSSEQKEIARTIDDSANTLLFLMQDILDLSKIEAGKVTVKEVDFDLYAMVRQTASIIEPQARFKGLRTSVRISPDVPFLLRGDPLLLRQVLLNLLGNATKFTERGEVGVRVLLESETPRRATIRFEIFDTGIGIAPEAQRKIFERFTQADDSITRRFGGTGLGTTISKEIVEMMGGSIGVESEPGRGSTFWFVVDLTQQNRKQDEAGFVEALAQRRALVLSADPGTAAALRAHLDGWKIRTDAVDRATRAFAQMVPASLDGHPYDIVLVAESGMDMDPAEFARAVKADPTIHDTHLILVRGEGGDATGPTEGYTTALRVPVQKRVLFNALHLSRSGDVEDPSKVQRISVGEEKGRNSRRLRVLVAEDNRTNQLVIEKILERMGHEPTIVTNGEEALDALKGKRFDVALFDLHMPVMGGTEAAKVYRFMETGPNRLPIVALTADATPEARKECEEGGMNRILTKPVDTKKLSDLFAEMFPDLPSAAREAGENDAAPRSGGESRPSPREETPALDTRCLQELADLGGNGDFVVRLAWTFLKGSKEKIREMERSVQERNAERTRELAHALKGNSGQIGAMTLMKACDRFSGISVAELERHGEMLLEEVKAEMSRVRVALDEYLGKRTSAVS